MLNNFFLILLLTPFTLLSAQDKDTIITLEGDTIFGVMDYFEHRQREAVATYEGASPTLFQAPDIDGDNHFLHEYIGKVVILQFFSIYSEPGLRQIPSLNRLIDEYGQQGLMILGMADNEEADLRRFRERWPVGYPLVPNSSDLGHKAYAADIGYPRIFIIDRSGIIRKLRVGNSADNEMALYEDILPLVRAYLKE